ncbi:phage major capsid protein [Mycobacterium europaeum]|uniref:phage major capsid protein n=1 Tax=Mycobacterium europaeum TaxID=761804 RepID=UPI002ADF6A39|nr:phage major capsid protein [Mycobacterium europaeum]MEA1160662.1 phage major capsid protein [Mycobacterium europaeum]
MKDKFFWVKHFGQGKTPHVYRSAAAGVLIDKSLSDSEKHAAIDALEELLPTAKAAGGAGWMRDLAAGGGAGAQVITKAALPKGRETAPLAFAESDLQLMHQAMSNRQQLRIKAFSSPDTQLPAQLSPQVIGPVHENRLLDRLPTQAIGSPSYEYIRHNSTTGAAAVVAEGAPKPELVLNTDTLTATAQKIAAHTATSWEALNDWANWVGYVQGELFRQIIDVENAELLGTTGDGTSGHLTGLLHTSGILTHAVANGTTNTLDDVEQSIAIMRTGAALAEPNLFVLHPNTWSAMRRTKDGYGRYLVAADPTKDEANQLWGVEVLVTTEQTAGTGLLIDTLKFGKVLVREGLSLMTGTNNDDFTRNLVRFVGEERLALAVERPAALLAITGLPTS